MAPEERRTIAAANLALGEALMALTSRLAQPGIEHDPVGLLHASVLALTVLAEAVATQAEEKAAAEELAASRRRYGAKTAA